MLITSDHSPLESAVERVSDITTVGEEVEAAVCALEGLEDCCDLPSLGSLSWPRDGSIVSVPIEEHEAPSGAGTPWCSAASPIGRDQGDRVGEECLGLPVEVVIQLNTARGRVVIIRDIARVPQIVWGSGSRAGPRSRCGRASM